MRNDFIKTPVSLKPSDQAIKSEVARTLDKFSTRQMLWHATKRHKFGLTMTYAIILTVFYFLPFLPSLIFSAFGK